MNYFSKKYESKKKSIIYMMLAYILLFSVAIFGQTVVEKKNIDAIINSSEFLNNISKIKLKNEVSSAIPNMNFVLWFMGAKQNPNTITLPIGTTESKQFINSGTVLNRLLIKTFLKKAMDNKSVLV